MRAKRVFLIVLDSVGAGEMPDAASFGDVGAHTLRSVWETGKLEIPNLQRLGIGNIDGLDFLGKTESPLASVARMSESSLGKDTTVGHWEIAGHVSNAPLPTFPNGFPEEILQKVRRISGRELLCNKTYSGTAVINDYGREAKDKNAIIIYTSADSVLQLAAQVNGVMELDELYRICEELREELVGEEQGVGRVIARPYIELDDGAYKRTADRRDYSLAPPRVLLPEAIKDAGLSSVAIGKISDIFAGVGFTASVRTHSNAEGMELTENFMSTDFCGLCFTNLVDFDMNWGHRRDAEGYAKGLSEFDAWLGRVLLELSSDDVLIITADHGCDPKYLKTTDHTREYTPLIVYGKNTAPENFGTRRSFADIAATVAELLGVEFETEGSALALRS
ncbi:MAG: phosphopentomutase [Ruminococcaceae bacterium]|nr:phosphopentomutase [Oscillospiraceae bacterium]